MFSGEGIFRCMFFELKVEACVAVQGEMLELIRRVDSNWYEGRGVGGGPSGIFPVSYVETLVDPESFMSTPMSSLATSPLPGQHSYDLYYQQQQHIGG